MNQKYEIYDNGDIFSTHSNKFLKPILIEGYLKVTLYVDGLPEKYSVHRLVAESFISNPDNLITVNHIDGNKLNNNVINLEWLSQSDNMRHAWRTGLMRSGSDTSIAKLTEEDIPEIRQLMVEGLSNQDIAERYCVARGTISKIRDGKTWKHVPCEVDVPKTSVEFKKKLSAEDIPDIRDLHRKGASLAEIGRIFNVHSGSISGIISGKSWKNY